jgi:long-chain fatty acid transport protein
VFVKLQATELKPKRSFAWSGKTAMRRFAMRRILILCAMLAIVAVSPVEVMAQSDAYAFTGINFNFTNPGARARGIGGAFVALADDSTSALANPAGLGYLDREFTLELASDEEEYPVGQLTQGGYVDEAQSVVAANDPFRVSAASDSTRVNYASFLFPIVEDKLTIGAYYATLADLSASFSVGAGVTCVDSAGNAYLPRGGEPCPWDRSTLYIPQNVDYSLETRLLGGALGYRVNDSLSLGLSLAYADTSLSGTAFLDRDAIGADSWVQRTEIDDTDLIFSLGVLYRSDYWGFGINYRSDAAFETENERLDLAGNPYDPDQFPPFSGELTMPQRIAVGFAIFPADNWVIAAEVDEIAYSDVISGMHPFDTTAESAGIHYRIDDVTEYHLGAEYTTFKDRRGWSLRFGWWRDETHLPWVSEPYTDPLTVPDDSLRAQESLIRAHDPQKVNHYTAGFGISGERLRVDMAVDSSDEGGTDFLLSGVVYF